MYRLSYEKKLKTSRNRVYRVVVSFGEERLSGPWKSSPEEAAGMLVSHLKKVQSRLYRDVLRSDGKPKGLEQLRRVQCSRCGAVHWFPIRRLARPTDEHKYWALCPTTRQPMLYGDSDVLPFDHGDDLEVEL